MTVAWNPADKGPAIVLSNGNLTASVAGTGWNGVRADLARSGGKYHLEFHMNSLGAAGVMIGLADAVMALTSHLGTGGQSCGIEIASSNISTQAFASGSFARTITPSGAPGQRWGLAVDLDAGKAWLSRDGVYFGGGDPVAGTNPWMTFTPGLTLFPAAACYTPSDVLTLYADQAGMLYGPPSGYEPWAGAAPPPPPPPPPSGPAIYANPDGNDSEDGLSPDYPVKTLQVAFDLAGALDVPPPYTWAHIGNVGYRNGVTVQTAPNLVTNPYLVPVPLHNDCGKHPITLRGDPANPGAHHIYANNTLQGLTAQGGGHTICDGFSIKGDGNCTLLNPLMMGAVSARNVIIAQGETGLVSAAGAAMGSQLNIIGKLTLAGPGFQAVFAAIEAGRLNWAPGAEVFAANPLSYEVMFAMQRGQAWTQGAAIAWTGAWGASSGRKGRAAQVSIFACTPGGGNAVPGALPWEIYDNSIVL